MHATAWMRHYVLDYADQMPHACIFRIDSVYRKDLHTTYRRHGLLVHHNPVKYSRFCDLWKKFFDTGIFVDGVKYKLEMRPGITVRACINLVYLSYKIEHIV